AEDGIRDDLVTGVQTCALPISSGALDWPGVCYEQALLLAERHAARPALRQVESRPLRLHPEPLGPLHPAPDACNRFVWNSLPARSEERRVGKECRCGAGRDGVE